jgi:2-keto-4-pentenoate hydratase/2-oxohepta-3-ene-1,7-dioic acid hydratase in catechol pathway
MFALGMFGDGNRTFAGLVRRVDEVVDLGPEGWSSTRDILADWDAAFGRLQHIAESDEPTARPAASLRVLAPVTPVQVLQSGANYRRHVIDIILAEERQRGQMSPEQALAMGERIMDERAANGEPYLFFGTATAMCGPHDDVLLPADGDQHDWELELAAVIGRPGRHIPVDQALEHVAGYTIVNDITTRDLVYRPDLEAIGTDWLRAKNAPTFLPTGPYLVPAAFVPDPMALTVTLRLNGEVMQDGTTADMIYDVADLVAYASRRVALRPGDLVLTGSPAGNGMYHGRFLKEGDVMVGEITHLGQQRNRCVLAARVATP